MLLSGVHGLLASFASITDLVGDQISPLPFPEGQHSCGLTYEEIGGSSKATFMGSGPQRMRIQITAYARTQGKADQLRNTVREAINLYRGQLSDGTFVSGVFLIGPVPVLPTVQGRFRAAHEYYFNFNFTS